MDDLQELLIREEARFVLWALRCAAAAGDGRGHAGPGARAELERVFELVDVPETADAFWRFAGALCRGAGERIVWHDPQCACVSAPEMTVLHQLASVAERLGQADEAPDWGWQALVPAAIAAQVDRLARDWLRALGAAGIRFPTPSRMIASLGVLQNLIEPPAPSRLQ